MSALCPRSRGARSRQPSAVAPTTGDHLGLTGTKYGCGVAQCGYCQAGQIMSAVSLLEAIPNPSGEDIDRGMAGNVCRCAT